MHILEIVPSKCNGCGICEVACSQYLTGEANPEKSGIRLFRQEDKAITFPLIVSDCEVLGKQYPLKGGNDSHLKMATMLQCSPSEEGALTMLCGFDDCKKAVCVEFCPMEAIKIVEEIPLPEKAVGLETIANSLLTIGRK